MSALLSRPAVIPGTESRLAVPAEITSLGWCFRGSASDAATAWLASDDVEYRLPTGVANASISCQSAASRLASRSIARWRICSDGGISGLGGCRIAFLPGLVLVGLDVVAGCVLGGTAVDLLPDVVRVIALAQGCDYRQPAARDRRRGTAAPPMRIG
jgi:hypothetical protein